MSESLFETKLHVGLKRGLHGIFKGLNLKIIVLQGIIN